MLPAMENEITIILYDDAVHRNQVTDLWENVFGYPADYNAPEVVIDRKIAVDDLLFVAVEGGAVVGTVMAGYDGHRGWIYSLAVRTDSRSRGIGSMLLAAAEQALAGQGCIKVNLQILDSNAGACRFYEANGYGVEARISMGKKLA
ncbi:GNAT family acetyltransferase [Pseudodesulfovibrio portus]|uniref:GNAT family acetyltransferase n=2 Tax=Pseudodesulfovibrio portus TaxID=231439 RepID=A0ABM8ARA5_9BACT|nr:GNAT family acetyltransferase [Pseudodesulfovibrio portus]